MKPILLTSALPYANGPIHIGHLLEYVQTDIFARASRLFGRKCVYLCADDAHGTPIMLKARSLGVSPDDLVANMQKEHIADFKKYSISFDCYHSTHSPENQFHTNRIYQLLLDRGYIQKKTISLAYDPVESMFLPDRFISGTCPRCNSNDQYGDGCEQCGATYSPSELINPISKISGATPITKDSEHLYFDLAKKQDFLREYISSGALQPEITNKMKEWVEGELKSWDISRDQPYFGFSIPNESNKYFYVWLDAPIGYMAACEKYIENEGRGAFSDWWSGNASCEIIHVIGKDIAYFHCLFWPAILSVCKHHLPSKIQCHGFVTLNGEKMSKSKGNFITARSWAEQLESDHLRYYYATKIQGGIQDVDIDFTDYENRINSDIIGKLINIPSRCSKLLHTHCNGALSNHTETNPFQDQLIDLAQAAQENYTKWNSALVVRDCMALADDVNAYLSDKKPWHEFKNGDAKQAQLTCTVALEIFHGLANILFPIIPNIAQKGLDLFSYSQPDLSLIRDQKISLRGTLRGTTLKPFTPLSMRVDASKLQALLERRY